MVLVTKQKRQNTSVTHKKRYGQHRKQTKPYLQTYWPYLPLILIVGLGLMANSLWSHRAKVLGTTTNISVSSLLTDTNAERLQDNEPGLRLNAQLDAAAQAKANNMVALNYWSHDTPSGQPPWIFITQAGYQYQSAGENLAYGFSSSSTILAGWMNSPSHRANILNAAYQDVGFGIANASNYRGTGPETVVVAMYGQPVSSQTVAASTPITTSPSTTLSQPAPQSVSRIQVAADGSASWSLLVVASVATLGIAFLLIRHGVYWRRAIVHGETFVIEHPWLDIGVVSIVMIAFVLSRSAGTIL